MKLIEALNLDTELKHIISIVGAGGKTTTMFRLAEEFKSLGKRVLITTTTAIFIPEYGTYDFLVIKNDLDSLILQQMTPMEGSITVIGSSKLHKEKLKGIDPELVEVLINTNNYDIILIEADGAKRKPIKAPDSHEPVIPLESTMVIGCIGIDCIGKSITDQWVHRAKIFANVVNQELDEVIDYETIKRLVLSKEGLFKTCHDQQEKVVLINKVIENDTLSNVRELGKRVIKKDESISKVLIGRVQYSDPILEIIERLE